MGLFSNNKKLCPICGSPTPRLLATKIEGQPICKECDSQIDLPDGKQSGLREALRVLDGVEGIAQCFLTEKDVVRHELVQRIVKAYAEYENKKGKGKPAAKPAGKRLPTRRKEGK